MGDQTLSEFRTDLEFDLDERDDLTTARLNRWINQAYMHMTYPGVRGLPGRHFKECEFRATITLVQDQAEYDISAATIGRKVHYPMLVTYHQATSLSPTNTKRKLDPRSYQYFEERTLPPGQPNLYTWFSETLIIMGVPTSAEAGQLLRLAYYGEPTRLTADGDTTTLPEYFDLVLRKGALWAAQASLNMFAAAAVTKQEYGTLLNEGSTAQESQMVDTGFQAGVQMRDGPLGPGT